MRECSDASSASILAMKRMISCERGDWRWSGERPRSWAMAATLFGAALVRVLLAPPVLAFVDRALTLLVVGWAVLLL